MTNNPQVNRLGFSNGSNLEHVASQISSFENTGAIVNLKKVAHGRTSHPAFGLNELLQDADHTSS